MTHIRGVHLRHSLGTSAKRRLENRLEIFLQIWQLVNRLTIPKKNNVQLGEYTYTPPLLPDRTDTAAVIGGSCDPALLTPSSVHVKMSAISFSAVCSK